MRKNYYAYGSNLNIYQMHHRCPTAEVVGYGFIEGYRLVFKGSGTGAYLTIEPHDGSRVPVGVYSVTEQDEVSLDRYEGYPRFYRKERRIIRVRDEHGEEMRDGFLYIMNWNKVYGIPTQEYVDICMEGYDDFCFDRVILEDAVRRAHGRKRD